MWMNKIIVRAKHEARNNKKDIYTYKESMGNMCVWV